MATMQCFVRQDGNDEFGGKNLTSMALLPATNASSAGGPHSIVGEHHGGGRGGGVSRGGS